ncbi:AMP-binding protein [Aquabacterium humicola]|uniref:AMP-binding protein n=1 Tax=Aquabacterium humicola TaxID=3237377 RepID=UPI0025436BE4|nr:AMP-binding protein [Rubrivivax pictus]
MNGQATPMREGAGARGTKPWLARYPAGIPAEVDVQAFGSLVEVLADTCGRHAQLPAFRNMGEALSYADLDRASRDFAAWLQCVATLPRGARVAIMLPNLLQYPIALFGVLRAGLVVVNVNPQYTPSELEHQLRDSGASAILVLENFAHTVQQVLERNPGWKLTVLTTQVGDCFAAPKRWVVNATVKHVKKMVPAWHIDGAIPFGTALEEGHAHAEAFDPVPLARSDLAFLQYTGGTTGVAKGAMLTHGNLVANVQQLAAWIGKDLLDGRETLMCPLPLYHVYALTSMLVFVKIGACSVLVTNPRDLKSFIAELHHERCSAIIGVNTLYRAMLDAPGFETIDWGGLKVAAAGGMAVQRIVAERWHRATGTPLIEGYGLTETSPVVISNPLDIGEWTGTIGLPLPSTDAAVLDDDGRELPRGEVGEICLRGPQVMAGYWQRPDETARTIVDGWLRTGDMGTCDESGWFRITDRKKDMIIVSGFKVFPNQIEDAVALHPGVAEVAAVGVPDERSGEAVKLFVVRADPTLTEAALLAHCRQHLTDYKLPRTIEFRDEPLPKTNLGKILRRALRPAPPTAPPA